MNVWAVDHARIREFPDRVTHRSGVSRTQIPEAGHDRPARAPLQEQAVIGGSAGQASSNAAGGGGAASERALEPPRLLRRHV